MKQEININTLIVGGGPSGLSASIYSARDNLSTMIIDIDAIGGKLNNYNTIENFPSYLNKDTTTLIEQLSEQIIDLGVQVQEWVDIEKVDLLNKVVETNDSIIRADKIIIATGSSPRKLGIKGESELVGKGVSYCATCDGPFFKNKCVAVIGGGNSAIEEAIHLTKFATKVYIIHRRDSFRADMATFADAYENSKIEFILNHIPISIVGKDQVNQLIIKSVRTGDELPLNVDGVFPFIGVSPNTDMFKSQLITDENGFIITDDCMRTNVKGVYAVGDVRNTKFRQVISACSDGATAGHFISLDK